MPLAASDHATQFLTICNLARTRPACIHCVTKGQRGWPLPAGRVEDIGVDHRRSHLAVAEQLLDCADVLAPLQEMSGLIWP